MIEVVFSESAAGSLSVAAGKTILAESVLPLS